MEDNSTAVVGLQNEPEEYRMSKLEHCYMFSIPYYLHAWRQGGRTAAVVDKAPVWWSYKVLRVLRASCRAGCRGHED